MGHTELAGCARSAVAPDAQLYFVPAVRSPHKAAGPAVSDQDRVAMLGLATDGLADTHVWTDEIDRARLEDPEELGKPGGGSYWVATLARARSQIGTDRRLLFLIGSDQAVCFDRWHKPEKILEMAQVVVIGRGGVRSAGELAHRLAGTRFCDRLVGGWCDVPAMDISATQLREAIAAKNDRVLAGAVHRGVALYIAQHGLYRGTGS